MKFKFQTSYFGISNIFTSQLFQRPLRSSYLKETGVSNGHTTWPKAQDSDHWCGRQRLPLAPLRSLPRAAGNSTQVNPPTTLPIPAVLGHWSKFKLRGHLSSQRLSSSCYLYLLCHCRPCRFFLGALWNLYFSCQQALPPHLKWQLLVLPPSPALWAPAFLRQRLLLLPCIPSEAYQAIIQFHSLLSYVCPVAAPPH